jgi:hypothetical protein
MIRTWLGVPVLACLLLGLGCSSARMVSWTGTEGVVAIPRDSNVWPCYCRTEANKLMAEKCPNGFQIVEEGEIVSGKAVVQPGGTNTSRTQLTDSTEYRLKFRQTPETPSPEPSPLR